MRNEIEKISNRLHKLQGRGFKGKYVVYFDQRGGVSGEERELGIGPKLYTRAELSRLAVPTEPKPDTRPEEVKEAQLAMEVAEAEFNRADEAWWAAKDASIKLRRSSFGTNSDGEGGYNNPEKIRIAEIRIQAELEQREEAEKKLRAARAQYNSLMGRWSAKKAMDEYAASVQTMQQRKRAEVEKRRRTLFGFLKSAGNGNVSNVRVGD